MLPPLLQPVRRAAALAALVALTQLACSEQAAPVETAAARGEKIYRNVCTTCHNADPSKEGVLGPPIAGASRELLLARVVHGEYPPGYQPKRPGQQQMPVFPHLEPYIDDLTEYLAATER